MLSKEWEVVVHLLTFRELQTNMLPHVQTVQKAKKKHHSTATTTPLMPSYLAYVVERKEEKKVPVSPFQIIIIIISL